MAIDPYAKIAPGERLPGLPAAPWNDMLDVVTAFKGGGLGSLGALKSLAVPGGIIPIRNDTGEALSRFSVLGISGFMISPSNNLQQFKNRPCLTGDTPIATDLERFVIVQQPCRIGGICDGMLVGVTPVQIDVVDETDDYADLITSDSTKLRSQPYGNAWIAYKESGTGTKWGLVVMGVQGSQFVLGKSNTAIAKGSGAANNVNVYRGTTAGSESFVSSKTITAWNHFADVASGKWVLCVQMQRNFRICAAEC